MTYIFCAHDTMWDIEVTGYGHDDIYPPQCPCKVDSSLTPSWHTDEYYHVYNRSKTNWNCSLKKCQTSQVLVERSTYPEKQLVRDAEALKTTIL